MSKSIPVWHIIYIIIICLLFIIFSVLIIPRCISDYAYQIFSFAATIVSIVLAVVSIVYSLQSGLSSVSQLNSIRDIETRIGTELNRFSNLESSIQNKVKEIVEPIQASLGDIQHQQDDIQKAQDSLANNWKEFTQNINKITDEVQQNDIAGELKGKEIPQILYVILYACLGSKNTGKDIPYHILAKFFGPYSFYCQGIINGLSIFQPEHLKIKIGSKANRQTIESYDEKAYGTKEFLSQQIKDGKNQKLGKDILQELDKYFENINEDCSDSINKAK